jgi:hypothetical protein
MRRHIHAMYQGFEALIAIESGKVIGGKLPPNALRMVRKWGLASKTTASGKLATGPHSRTVPGGPRPGRTRMIEIIKILKIKKLGGFR